MTDDPREVLEAAGVECAELDHIYGQMGERDYHGQVWYDTVFGADPEGTEAAILALARLVAPLARFLNAERALNDPEIMEGTTHCQTDAHVEADQAYREACAALGLDSFLEAHHA